MSNIDPLEFTNRIHGLLARHRFRSASERTLQNSLAELFQGDSLDASRECRLAAEDVVDFFFVDCGLALEVKVDGSLSSVTRQLHRYASHPEVRALMLVTTVNRHDHLPAEMQGKPLRVVVLPGGLA